MRLHLSFDFKGMSSHLSLVNTSHLAPKHFFCYKKVFEREWTDTQTDILQGGPYSAICVRRFDDSLNSAIHITYRSSLRSSSMHEPRDPPLKVVISFVFSFFLQIALLQKLINQEIIRINLVKQSSS